MKLVLTSILLCFGLIAGCTTDGLLPAGFRITLDEKDSSVPLVPSGGNGDSGKSNGPFRPSGSNGGIGSGDSVRPPSISFNVTTRRTFHLQRLAGRPMEGVELGITAFDATFRSVAGVIVASDGTVIVCDRDNNHIVAYPASGLPQMLTGDRNGQAGFLGDNATAASSRLSSPMGLAADQRKGVLFFCDSGNDRVRNFMPGNRLDTAAGGGVDSSDVVNEGVNARLDEPFGLVMDEGGNLYFTERGTGRLRKLSPDGQLITLATFQAGEIGPVAVSLTGERVWVPVGGMIRVLMLDGSSVVGSGELLSDPALIVTSLAYDQRENLYIATTSRAAFGLEHTRLSAIPLLADGTADPRRVPVVIGGSGQVAQSDTGYSAPVAPADAHTQPLAGAGYCSLYIDDGGGAIVAGNSYADAGGTRWGEVVKFMPKAQ